MVRLLTFTFALLLSAASWADVKVKVEHGWDGVYRPGRWAPLFITLTSDRPRQVNLELYAPHDRTFAMAIRESTAVDTKPTLIRMYVPLAPTLDELMVVVRDAATRRTVGQARADGMAMGTTYQGMVWQKTVTGLKLCIGVSGATPVPSLVHTQTSGNDAGVGFLELLRLPDAAIGYDTLDVLVLNAPDLTRLRREQQEAIADWVRAGGKLIYWPGADTVPPDSVLGSILPARVGPPVQFGLDDGMLREYGLQSRFKKLMVRQFDPLPGATTVPLLGARAYRRRVGLGEVLAIPFDPSQFALDVKPAQTFWSAAVGSIVPLAPPPPDRDNYNYAYQQDPVEARQDAALTAVMEVIGDVPGVGRFDFSYIALALIGLMVLVGPVDFFVLRRMGKQPWTWVTTGACIVLVTAGAVFIGQRTREGRVHYNSVQLVDEADGATVATTTVAAIYSPKTDNYDLAADPDSWWSPAAPPQRGYWVRTAARNDVPFHQTYRGNTPVPQRINIWNQRFMVGRTFAIAPGVVTATLTNTGGRIQGTITNNSDLPLTEVSVTTRGGRATLPAAIEPKATVPIDAALSPTPDPPAKAIRPNNMFWGATQASPDEYRQNFAWYAPDLVGPRSVEIERKLATGEVAYVHAVVTAPAGPGQLTPTPESEKHVRIVRSVVTLGTSPK